MKNMIKFLSIVILLFSLSITANAQTKAKHGNKHKKEMMKSLNLSQQQKEQMKISKEALKNQKEAIKNSTTLSDEQKKERMKQLQKERHEKMQAILTPEQKQKMKQMKKNKPRRGVTNLPNERTAK
jgi:Spy/CpxP family protein refolding chaperone